MSPKKRILKQIPRAVFPKAQSLSKHLMSLLTKKIMFSLVVMFSVFTLTQVTLNRRRRRLTIYKATADYKNDDGEIVITKGTKVDLHNTACDDAFTVTVFDTLAVNGKAKLYEDSEKFKKDEVVSVVGIAGNIITVRDPNGKQEKIVRTNLKPLETEHLVKVDDFDEYFAVDQGLGEAKKKAQESMNSKKIDDIATLFKRFDPAQQLHERSYLDLCKNIGVWKDFEKFILQRLSPMWQERYEEYCEEGPKKNLKTFLEKIKKYVESQSDATMQQLKKWRENDNGNKHKGEQEKYEERLQEIAALRKPISDIMDALPKTNREAEEQKLKLFRKFRELNSEERKDVCYYISQKVPKIDEEPMEFDGMLLAFLESRAAQNSSYKYTDYPHYLEISKNYRSFMESLKEFLESRAESKAAIFQLPFKELQALLGFQQGKRVRFKNPESRQVQVSTEQKKNGVEIFDVQGNKVIYRVEDKNSSNTMATFQWVDKRHFEDFYTPGVDDAIFDTEGKIIDLSDDKGKPLTKRIRQIAHHLKLRPPQILHALTNKSKKLKQTVASLAEELYKGVVGSWSQNQAFEWLLAEKIRKTTRELQKEAFRELMKQGKPRTFRYFNKVCKELSAPYMYSAKYKINYEPVPDRFVFQRKLLLPYMLQRFVNAQRMKKVQQMKRSNGKMSQWKGELNEFARAFVRRLPRRNKMDWRPITFNIKLAHDRKYSWVKEVEFQNALKEACCSYRV